MTDEPQPGQRWRFDHGGYPWDITIDRVKLDPAVIHGKLMTDGAHPALGRKGDLIIVPTSTVKAGERVEPQPDKPDSTEPWT